MFGLGFPNVEVKAKDPLVSCSSCVGKAASEKGEALEVARVLFEAAEHAFGLPKRQQKTTDRIKKELIKQEDVDTTGSLAGDGAPSPDSLDGMK